MYIKAWRIKRDFTGNAKPCCGRGKAPVSTCEPLCAILLAKASVYPPQSLETNVAALVPEVLKSV